MKFDKRIYKSWTFKLEEMVGYVKHHCLLEN